jgi:transcriptional regulator GlxA family with amidase domain
MINIMYDPQKLSLPESGLRSMPGYCAIFLLEPNARVQHRFRSHLHLKRMELAHVERIAQEMEEEKKENRTGKEVVLLSRLMDLFVYLSRLYVNSTDTHAGELLRVGKAISALEQDYTRQWTLPELIKITHMSRSTLLRVFRKATGNTPIDYLIRLRVQRAMELIRKTEGSITHIAMETGFNDSNYFARQFRKIVGVSPSTYRNQSKS